MGVMAHRARVAALVALVCALSACSGSFTDRAHRTLNTTLAATNAARDEFVAWDKAKQLELVDAAETKEAAEAALAEYRRKRAPVLRAFTIAYTSIAAAAAMVPLVDKGIKKESDLVPLLTDAVNAAVELKKAYDVIKGD